LRRAGPRSSSRATGTRPTPPTSPRTAPALHPALRLPAEATLVSKGTGAEEDAYSCFQARAADGTEFAALLARRGIRRLFVGGLATDYCVKATALDARKAGLDVVVLEDAVRAVDVTEGDGDRALGEMAAAGASRTRLPAVA
jgi:nicotinamidase/pyrazinamidase